MSPLGGSSVRTGISQRSRIGLRRLRRSAAFSAGAFGSGASVLKAGGSRRCLCRQARGLRPDSRALVQLVEIFAALFRRAAYGSLTARTPLSPTRDVRLLNRVLH